MSQYLFSFFEANSGCNTLSQERIIKILESFGLKPKEAEVYVYLAKKGPLMADVVSVALKLDKQKLGYVLRNLQKTGIVTKSYPAVFSAMDFEDVLDFFIKLNVEQAQALNESKEELLSSWRSMLKQK